MNDSEQRSSVDHAVPKSDSLRNLEESEKRALELQEQAEHETGPTRKRLDEKVREKTQE